MKMLFFVTLLSGFAAGCATSMDESRGTSGPGTEIYHGGETGAPGGSGTGLRTMRGASTGNSSQDNPQVAVPSANSYQPNRY